jgi:hypothetical protein
MKISRDPDHPAYSDYHGLCHVRLEGSERNNIRFADEEARYAETWRLDEFGAVATDKAGKPLTDLFTATFGWMPPRGCGKRWKPRKTRTTAAA